MKKISLGSLGSGGSGGLTPTEKILVDNILGVKVDLVSVDKIDITGTEQTIDGIDSKGKRVLLIGQTAPKENGIYLNSADGTTWTRTLDCNTRELMANKWVLVQSGNVYMGAILMNVEETPIEIGTSSIRYDFIKDSYSYYKDLNFSGDLASNLGTFSFSNITTPNKSTIALRNVILSSCYLNEDIMINDYIQLLDNNIGYEKLNENLFFRPTLLDIVSQGGYESLEQNLITDTVVQTTSIWQSFAPRINAYINSVSVYISDLQDTNGVFSLYASVGTIAVSQILTFPITLTAGENIITFPDIVKVTKDNDFTISIETYTPNEYDADSTKSYTRGVCSDPDKSLKFSTTCYPIFISVNCLSGGLLINTPITVDTITINKSVGIIDITATYDLLIDRNKIKIKGDSRARTLKSITSGVDGQEVIIVGQSDTNTVTISATLTSGVKLAGGVDFTLGLGDIIRLHYDIDVSAWCEVTRSNNNT